MPYTLRKVRNKNCYSLKNKNTGKIYSKCTSKDKAKKQLRLLRSIEYGWKPSRSRSKRKRSHF